MDSNQTEMLLPGMAQELADDESLLLPLADIQLRARVRELDEEKLKDLQYSIERDGLLQPLVVAQHEDQHVLIAGGHRLEVCKRLHWKLVPVRVLHNIRNEDHLVRLELSENLFRNELSLLERAIHLNEYLKRDSALSALSADQIAEQVNISRRTFFYYKQVAQLPREQVQRILKLPQDLKNSRQKLLDFYNLPTDEVREDIIHAMEHNPATTYSMAKGAATKMGIEAGRVIRPLTITQVVRSRILEAKEVRSTYFYDVPMTDFIDYVLAEGLEQLRRKDYRVQIPVLDLLAEMLPNEESLVEEPEG